MDRMTRIQKSLLGCTLVVQYISRGHPRPGIDVELDTPWATFGGYVHA